MSKKIKHFEEAFDWILEDYWNNATDITKQRYLEHLESYFSEREVTINEILEMVEKERSAVGLDSSYECGFQDAIDVIKTRIKALKDK